ncbi:unnamed protein product [Penicillium salamii]|nr:unnamed protein product [Penicillium salamii]CAG8381376.1 unnamed protein product [Penicillium salamii]
MLSRNYERLPKTDADGDSDVTITSRQSRRGLSGFLKRNLAAITITGLLLVLMLLVVAVITAITVEPFRQILVMKSPMPIPTGHTGKVVYPIELQGQGQCLPTKSRTTYSCGNSTTEAEKRGCAYDPLAGCWLHKECPQDFTHEFSTFNNGKPFVYYYDEAMTQQMMDYEEVGRNPARYWTSIREHLVHCLYLLRRGYEVHMRGDRLDTMLGDLEHVDHCTNMLADWLRRDDPVLDHVGTSGFTHCFISYIRSRCRSANLTTTSNILTSSSIQPQVPTQSNISPKCVAMVTCSTRRPRFSSAITQYQYDTFIFVTPEYHRSIQVSLKNALDYLYFEWKGKPAGIVLYGTITEQQKI